MRVGDNKGRLPDDGNPIIVFDAMCVLCSFNAQFILRHDHARVFRFASMQGEIGQKLYHRFSLDPANPESFIVVQGDIALRESDAVLAIWSRLAWPWRGLTVLRYVPQSVRDLFYRLVARNRYRWFGKRETCWMPSMEQRSRIL